MPAEEASSLIFPFERVTSGGETAPVARPIAQEVPVALEFNGIGYAVLMASPGDLADLATGFALAERLIDGAADIVDVEPHAAPAGLLVRLTLTAACAPRVFERVRHRLAESGCGLCGIENLEQALRRCPASPSGCPPTTPRSSARLRAVRVAAAQPLTGAVHAAAACSRDGTIRLVREDVGRHNAFDKLNGAMLRQSLDWDGGFALLSSRCSYELVEKAVLSDCPMLVTISAPTSLAVARAEEAGLQLRVLARPDALLAVTPGARYPADHG
jgi:FdhD protein